MNLAKAGAVPQAWGALGLVRVVPTAWGVPLASVQEFSFWYRAPGALPEVRLQHFFEIRLASPPFGSAEAIAAPVPIAHTLGWAKLAFGPATLYSAGARSGLSPTRRPTRRSATPSSTRLRSRPSCPRGACRGPRGLQYLWTTRASKLSSRSGAARAPPPGRAPRYLYIRDQLSRPAPGAARALERVLP